MPAAENQFDSAEHRHVAVLCPVGCDGAEFRATIAAVASDADRLTVVRDAMAAMVELHRGAQRLIVPWPAKTAALGELLTAAARYFPQVGCVDAAGLPLVGASVSPTTVESDAQNAAKDEIDAAARRRTDAGSRAGTGTESGAASGNSAAPSAATGSNSSWAGPESIGSHRRPVMAPEDLLTDEELAMLMGPIREG